MSEPPPATTSGAPTTASSGGQTQGRGHAGRGNGRGRGRGHRGGGRRGRIGGGGSGSTTNAAFVGDTPKMNGAVFQTPGETDDRQQFRKTLEALDAYAAGEIGGYKALRVLFSDIKTPVIEKPASLPKKKGTGEINASEEDRFTWQEETKVYLKDRRQLNENLVTLYRIAYGQCSESMRARVRGSENYQAKSEEQDVVWLLNLL